MQLNRIALVVLTMMLVASSARASAILYGNFGPNTAGDTFLNVQESSGTDAVPLYGAPTLTSIGLDFNPAGFVASSTGASGDITDGQLNYSIKNAGGMSELSIFEGGDYSFTSIGGAAASVAAGLSLRANITEIDNVALPSPISVPVTTASFSANAPPSAFSSWNLGLLTNLDSAISNIPHQIGVTKVDIVIDNDLTALSTANAAAFIAKKDFQFAVNTDISKILPEPSTFALAGIVICGALGRRSKRA